MPLLRPLTWFVSLAVVRSCGGADACFVAGFDGERGGRLPSQANFTRLRLAGGDPARFHPVTCGGSCAPATLWFVHRGVLYTWQVATRERGRKNVLIRLANAAIASASS